MQEIVNQLLNAFIDAKKTTKLYILVANTLGRIDVRRRRLINIKVNEYKTCLKCSRPIDSKDTKKVKI